MGYGEGSQVSVPTPPLKCHITVPVKTPPERSANVQVAPMSRLPSAPSAPSAPVAPCGPVGPAGPVAPCGPVAPSAPSVPVAPCGPVAPVAPSAPSVPVAPCGPVAPSAPSAPCGPAGPVAPSAPSAPCGPVGPAGPAGPVRASAVPASTNATVSGSCASLLDPPQPRHNKITKAATPSVVIAVTARRVRRSLGSRPATAASRSR